MSYEVTILEQSINVITNEVGEVTVTTDISEYVQAASQAQVNTGTSTTTYVSPSTLKNWAGNDSIVIDAYGCVGDGVTDNTATLQSIITTYAGQRIVIVSGPDDIYLIDKALTVPSDSVI